MIAILILTASFYLLHSKLLSAFDSLIGWLTPWYLALTKVFLIDRSLMYIPLSLSMSLFLVS